MCMLTWHLHYLPLIKKTFISVVFITMGTFYINFWAFNICMEMSKNITCKKKHDIGITSLNNFIVSSRLQNYLLLIEPQGIKSHEIYLLKKINFYFWVIYCNSYFLYQFLGI